VGLQNQQWFDKKPNTMSNKRYWTYYKI